MVENNPNLYLCPGENCGVILNKADASDDKIYCQCGLEVCFLCGRLFH